jgi:hypothetical protein
MFSEWTTDTPTEAGIYLVGPNAMDVPAGNPIFPMLIVDSEFGNGLQIEDGDGFSFSLLSFVNAREKLWWKRITDYGFPPVVE